MNRFLASFVLFGLPLVVVAQAPKGEPKWKFTQQQVTEAEQALTKANCNLHREEDKFQLKAGKLVVVPSNKQIDHIAFPNTVKDADLARLLPFAARLPHLRSIDLGHCANISEKGLRHLKSVPGLLALFLDHTPATALWLSELGNLKMLQWLDLSATPLTDDAIKKAGGIERLNTLVVRQMPNLTDEGIKNIVNIGQLRYLDITIERDPGKMAAALANAKLLLSLKVSPVSDEEAAHLGKIAGIETLDLSNDGNVDVAAVKPNVKKGMQSANTIGDDGVKKLAGCTSLRSLNLAYTTTSGEGFEALVDLKRFEDLNVKGTKWDDKALAVLARFPLLNTLDLRSTKVSDAGMELLADLPALERLYLGLNPITDIGLSSLTKLQSLRVLDLSGSRIRLAAVRDLKNLIVLEQLHLQATGIGRAAVDELAKLKSLRYLNVRDNCPDIGKAEEIRLTAELPNTLVHADWCNGFVGAVSGWPGAKLYAFRLPEIKYNQPPNITSPNATGRMPMGTTPVPMAPPPVLRIPSIGGGSPKS